MNDIHQKMCGLRQDFCFLLWLWLAFPTCAEHTYSKGDVDGYDDAIDFMFFSRQEQ